MPVRLRYDIRFSISSTPAEERDLANPWYEVLTDTQEDGGISKTLVSAGQQNVPLSILNLEEASFLVIRINSRDPTLPPNPVIIGINNPGEVTIGVLSPPASIPLITLSNPGTVTTVVTALPHNLTVGQSISITGTNSTPTAGVFNGYWVVATIINSTSFTFAQTVGTAQSGTGGSVQASVFGLENLSGTTVVTSNSPHGFSVGDQIVVFGTSNDTLFSGVFTIASIPSTTTFTYPQTFGTYPQFGNGGTAQILGASEITIAPVGDAVEGHLLVSSSGITELYGSNPGTTNMDVTVSVAGPLP